MGDKRTVHENFDDLLAEPFKRIDRMVAANPVARCDRMLRRLELLERELNRFLSEALLGHKAEKQ